MKLNATMKHIKISPGNKSCNSQQEVIGCFGIRWDVFHRQDLLEGCRIQTSSAGNEQRYKKKITPAFHNGAPLLDLDSV